MSPGINFLDMEFPKPGDYATDQRHECLAQANLHVRVGDNDVTVFCPVHGDLAGKVAFWDGGWWIVDGSQVLGL